jgi:hypothetical protein
MVMSNYERIIEKISKISNKEKSEIELLVETKRARLSGLISKEGAAQIVAAELGINFDNQRLKIEELLPGMKKVNVIGKIINIYPIKTFKTKKGDESKVVNLILADETSNIKVVLWDTKEIALIESGELIQGRSIEIINGTMRDNEIHLGSFSEIKILDLDLQNVKTDKNFKESKISDLKKGESVKIRAFITQCFDIKFFYVCSSCGKKVNQEGNSFLCQEHGKVSAEKRALVSLVLDDGTDSIRAVVFQENLEKLGFNILENQENLINNRQSILGKEFFFFGSVRENKLFNNLEMNIENIEEIDLDNLIKELECKKNL